MLFVYIFCMLFPLILTDGAILYTVMHTEKRMRQSEREGIADAVNYEIFYDVDSVSKVAKSIYTNRYINNFLEMEYKDSLSYVEHYQAFFKDTLFLSGDMTGDSVITLYTDNSTIVSGGTVRSLDLILQSAWYQKLTSADTDQMLFFDYEPDVPWEGADLKRHVYFVRRMNYYGGGNTEKFLKIEMNYRSMNQSLQNMNYDTPIYVCYEDKIIFSNQEAENLGEPFRIFDRFDQVEYVKETSIYGTNLKIYVLSPENVLAKELMDDLPRFILLLFVNLVFPLIMVLILNRSLTGRITKLSDIFKNMEDENLVEITDITASDEIGEMMHNYNKMAARIKTLVNMVYKNRIREQEITVARQKAELLALRSQINPHFLFNALESIRMHSVIRRELITAEMVEKLAVMQRQYVDWGNDLIEVVQEIELVKHYLDLQKYRFGDRLSFEVNIEEECRGQKIPKLTIVTFVENACVHGIEKKTTPGWVFIQICRRENLFCIEIEDTGIGMDDEEIQAVQQRMNEASMELLKEEKGVGIVNACLRLKMVFGEKVRFEVNGEKGAGMTVLIWLPFVDEQKSADYEKGR